MLPTKFKITLLLILLLILSVPACSMKFGSEPSATASASTTPVSDSAGKEVKGGFAGGSRIMSGNLNPTRDTASADRPGGRYVCRTAEYQNEFLVRQMSDNQVQVIFVVGAEYNGTPGRLTGAASFQSPQKVTLDAATNSTGVLVYDVEGKSCEVTLKFSGDKLHVEQKGDCNFGEKISVAGDYRRSYEDFTMMGVIPGQSQSTVKNYLEQPIQFERGKSSATVTGKIQNRIEVIYTFDASAGQTAEVSVTTDTPNNDVVFSVRGFGGAKLMYGVDTKWKGRLPKTGTYKINVGTMESEKANFKLTLTVR